MKRRPVVKICGMTRLDDAISAVEMGASMIGFIFASGSPRRIGIDDAAAITSALRERRDRPSFVGVFRNQAADEVNAIVERAGLDVIQLHGEETPEIVPLLSRPVVKAVPVTDRLPDTAGWGDVWLLFDSGSAGGAGGTGRSFDWTLLRDHAPERPWFLAGGLDAGNVAAAIETAEPYGVDVASGVESEPGIKSRAKLQAFFDEIARVTREESR